LENLTPGTIFSHFNLSFGGNTAFAPFSGRISGELSMWKLQIRDELSKKTGREKKV